MKTKIKKANIGRPVDFKGAQEGERINGVVEKVRNGMATIMYAVKGTWGYTTCIPTNSERIIEAY